MAAFDPKRTFVFHQFEDAKEGRPVAFAYIALLLFGGKGLMKSSKILKQIAALTTVVALCGCGTDYSARYTVEQSEIQSGNHSCMEAVAKDVSRSTGGSIKVSSLSPFYAVIDFDPSSQTEAVGGTQILIGPDGIEIMRFYNRDGTDTYTQNVRNIVEESLSHNCKSWKRDERRDQFSFAR